MKYFLDTEFIERPGSIQLISIGIVSDTGRTFYAESTTFDERDANEWVSRNILSKLRWWGTESSEKKYCNVSVSSPGTDQEAYEVFGSIRLIRAALLRFFKGETDIEFYAYYADYDWVVFCWIFGRMIDLPDGFPMYCKDLKQMMDDGNLTSEWKKEVCPDPINEHNALIDALWNAELYDKICISLLK